ncbi:MAG: rRNA adenine dimethyltransferase family protein [Candidatus Nealsonbacteria bacterium]|nr:rRNA adenine dimethyltransferase family protein [Candidatus Nealsonbacteria bacterium]
MTQDSIKTTLKKRNLRPSKRLGQNFLIDKNILDKIAQAADLNINDIVLEIGPGTGALTKILAQKVHPVKSSQNEAFSEGERFNRVKRVVAVEKDRNMVKILQEELKGFKNVEIIHGDIRRHPLRMFGEDSPLQFKVVGNLPFYLTAPVIRKFLEYTETGLEYTESGSLYSALEMMVLVVQKEVGQRICAKPPRMNLLAVSIQVYAAPEIISYVSKNSFWPRPKVDAAIIKITPKNQLTGDSELFFKIVKAGFAHPRKQLINNLSGGLKISRESAESWLLKNNIQPTQRAETLSVDNWVNLSKTYQSYGWSKPGFDHKFFP